MKMHSESAGGGVVVAEMVGLAQMLEARERRAWRQNTLLAQYGLPVVSFTMNIAGPVKNSPLIRRGFGAGRRLLMSQLALDRLPVCFAEETDEPTGCEGLYVVDAAAAALKRIACGIEEHAPLGRLFDLDVLAPDGTKLERPAPRRCLVCGRPARECARSRTHSVEELQAATHALLAETFRQQDAEAAAALAVRALLYEVCVTPKPGLVDRANTGSHRDMDIYTFMNSASALWPYFARCVRAGQDTADRPAPETLAALRWPGRLAESAMQGAAGGVNTHKGAIFSVGLACAALGRLEREQWSRPEKISEQIAAMAAGLAAREFAGLAQKDAARATAGQRFYLDYGITGVRGEAERGFSAVLEYGLPALEKGLAGGKSKDEAGAAALLTLLAHTVDTNMIARGGIDKYRQKNRQLWRLLDESPYPERCALEALDREYIKENLSPGGSADLLALCWLLHFLKEEEV